MSQETLKSLDPEVQKILAKYDQKRAAVLTLLHLAQEKIGRITPEAIEWVARWTEVPPVHVKEVVTFYSMYRTEKGGKHHIRFCTSTSCQLLGAKELLAYLKQKLNISNGQTTPDGKFSLEEAECLCACEAAPMLQLDGPYIGNLDRQKIDQIIAKAS